MWRGYSYGKNITKNVKPVFFYDGFSGISNDKVGTVSVRNDNNTNTNGNPNFDDDGLFILPDDYVNEEIELYDDFRIGSAKLNNSFLYTKMRMVISL